MRALDQDLSTLLSICRQPGSCSLLDGSWFRHQQVYRQLKGYTTLAVRFVTEACDGSEDVSRQPDWTSGFSP